MARPRRGAASQEAIEQRTEETIVVRQVTHLQASWSERTRGEPGAFTVQLILDNGVDEYVIHPTADDADVLLELFTRSEGATFDTERKVLMFTNLSTDQV